MGCPNAVRGEGLVVAEVAMRAGYGVTWITITRQQRLGAPTDDPRVLAAGAAALMRRAWNRRPIRLIGLRAGRLTAHPEGDLVGARCARRRVPPTRIAVGHVVGRLRPTSTSLN